MKIVLSRKGFDAKNGGVPSPILEDGTLVSLPIPSNTGISYDQIQAKDCHFGKLVSDLTKGKIRETAQAHLDPDLNSASVRREINWRPLFGQTGAALTHLREISKGDLFLFFGWFRQVKRNGDGKYGYMRSAPHLHVLFGWMQVEQVWNCEGDEIPSWAQQHPHVGGKYGSVFVASERLDKSEISGGGTFRRFNESLCLTAPDHSRSIWRLPKWFYPFNSKAEREPLSYHKERNNWKLNDDYVDLQTAKIGQEFILDVSNYPEAMDWAHKLILVSQKN